jgi:hypothetical protein
VVGFDSIIPPGRAGTVTEEVNISSMHGGNFAKSATIFSNAKNKPSMQISMKGTVKEAVAASPDYIQVTKDAQGKHEFLITFTTEKADFKIEDVVFKDNQTPSDKSPTWQKELPIPVNFSLVKDSVVQKGNTILSSAKDSVTQKTDHGYKVKIMLNYNESANKSGEFIFKTNHPDAPEVKVSGTIISGK